MYKIGIDVGGTNTDAVLMNLENQVIDFAKVYTTTDIEEGIYNVLNQLLNQTKIDPNLIKIVSLGTTQCTNAIVTRKGLETVNVIRLASNTTHAIKPFCDWPNDLTDKVKGQSFIISGGYNYDNSVIGQINFEELDEVLNNCSNYNFAISCVNAPINDQQEIAVRNYIQNKYPQSQISISSEIGSLSLLERENATILNTALMTTIKRVVTGFKNSLDHLNINQAKIFFCQNDGTIMTEEYATNFPILTISSGPTNSIRGGVKLANLNDAIIIDVGGTTTDIGMVNHGLARESQGTTKIGGVTSNFRMPDVISVGLGGGTIIKYTEDTIQVGPESVGMNINDEAICFGGNTITLTDIAIRLGRLNIGSVNVSSIISLEFAQKVDKIIKQTLIDSVDLIRNNDQPANLIFVGGGSLIFDSKIFNNDHVYLPDNYQVANAVGASIVKLSGSHSSIYTKVDNSFDEPTNISCGKAINAAISAGANPSSVKIVEIDKRPIAYHPNEAMIIKTKAIGEFDF